MVRLHSLDLILDEPTGSRVRAQWDALAADGLPSQAKHRSSTNAPHVTVLQAASISSDTEHLVAETLAPYLPMRFTVTGLALLGHGPYVLAQLIQPNARTSRVVGDLRRRDLRPDRTWLPHVTLARRLRQTDLATALAAVARHPGPEVVVATTVRRWDPERNEVRTIATSGHPCVG